MASQVVPQLLRQHLANLAADDERISGRGQWQGREIELEVDCLYNADGSAKVVWGDTIVYVGVKFELREPYSDRPTSGSLMCGCGWIGLVAPRVSPILGLTWSLKIDVAGSPLSSARTIRQRRR
jgi:exosome complex component RRP42